MASHLILTLDTQPPASPGLVINGGATVTGAREVAIAITTADYLAGARDVLQMRIWGDVDPAADALVQPTEAASAWMTYTPDYVVRLSTGTARKTINARLKDDVCNVTVEFCDFIDLDLTSPVVQITTGVDRSRISKIAPCATALFVWQSTQAFDRYEVRVVPSIGSPHTTGVLLGTTNGSVNVAGVGSFPANVPISTTIHGADLEIASPGDTEKIIKTYVRTAGGVWSP